MLVVLASAATLAAVNWWDAPPSAAALRITRQLQAPRPPQPAPADNGYLWLLGLYAPEGASPVAWGEEHARQLRTVAEARHRVSSPGGIRPPTEAPEPDAALQAADARLAEFAKEPGDAPWCRPELAPCLVDRAVRRDELAARRTAQAPFLSRALQMQGSPAFEETYLALDLDSPSSPLKGLGNAQQAVFLEAAHRAETADLASAADLLRGDALFQRRVLSGTRELVTKMVANAQLTRNLLFARELLTLHAAPPDTVARYLEGVSVPLTTAEFTLAPSLATEAQLSQRVLAELPASQQLGGWDRVKFRLVYQPQRTINCQHDGMAPLFDLDRQPAAKYRQGLAAYLQLSEARSQVPWHALVVNPMGRILCGIAAPNLGLHIGRQHDLETLRRATVLALSAGRGASPAIVQASRLPAFENPYTEQPFEIDEANRLIRFEAGAPRQNSEPANGVVSVPY